jgi:serine protease AprX
LHDNLTLPSPLTGCSKCFLGGDIPWNKDSFGHGTHVAGIITGESKPDSAPRAAIQSTDEHGDGEYHIQPVDGIKGMAPLAKILVLRVLDDNGNGDETALIQAIEYIQKLNDYGRHIVVHGVNISAGFPSHPTWYACGQTPLCVEVDRLVKSGVTVVVAAGNSGHVVAFVDQNNTTEAGQLLSVNDPGNADLAITVGSTHRESPHTYGISYFSSKGPTSDGRQKPDVVAPGEKIISAASSLKTAGTALPGLNGARYDYIEDTGTSMAAPHVSGILAAFLSIKREFIGRPEDVKQVAMQSAMDLRRDQRLQGAGLIDLMKMIQSV